MQAALLPQNNTEQKVTLIVTLWGLATFFLGYFAVFSKIPRPLFGVAVFIIIAFLLLLYFRNKNFRLFSDGIPLRSIALFHSWRIFAGWLFLSFSSQLPAAFINDAAYGDIISGFLGLSVIIFGQTRLNYYIFNIIGLLDLILALGTGLYLIRMGNAQMANITLLPLIMIPLFGVPILVYTHIISLLRLGKIKTNKITDFIS
jgi:hypothetical protein